MKSFYFAFRGVIRSVREQRHMRIHLVVSFYVLAAAGVSARPPAQTLALLLCCAMVISAELLNTAVEMLCNRVVPGYDEKIGACKDIAAGAVLVCTLFSAAVGGLVFFRKEAFIKTWEFALRRPFWAILFILLLIPSAIFIRGKKNDQ